MSDSSTSCQLASGTVRTTRVHSVTFVAGVPRRERKRPTMSRRERTVEAHMLGVSSKNLPVDLFQHRARGIRHRRLSALTAAPRLRRRAAPTSVPGFMLYSAQYPITPGFDLRWV